MTKWACTSCGAQYEKREPPCEECGEGEFARIVDHDRSGQDIYYQCSECGHLHVRDDPPCSECGAMPLVPVELEDPSAVETTAASSDFAAGKRSPHLTVMRLLAYSYGVPIALLGARQIRNSNHIAGAALILSGFFALPVVRSRARKHLGIDISAKMAGGLVVTLLVVGVWLATAAAM